MRQCLYHRNIRSTGSHTRCILGQPHLVGDHFRMLGILIHYKFQQELWNTLHGHSNTKHYTANIQSQITNLCADPFFLILVAVTAVTLLWGVVATDPTPLEVVA